MKTAPDGERLMAAVLSRLPMRTAYDLFGTPQGSPKADKLIVAGIQWVKKIMEQIDCDGE